MIIFRIFILFGFIFSLNVDAFKPALSEADAQKFAKCMEKQNQQCESVDEKTKCKMEAFKNMDNGCKKLLKKAHQSLLPMGMACYGIMKICPFPSGDQEKALGKFEMCIQKNIDKMPGPCKGMMESYVKQMTRGEKGYKEVKHYVDKDKAKNKNVQVKQK